MPIKYPTEFKVKAIRRYEKGESIKELCKELNISQSTLYHWRKQYCSIQTDTRTYTPAEFDAISRRLRKVEHELEVIRLSGYITRIPLQDKLATLEHLHNEMADLYSVHELCEALDVSRGTFYNHIFRRVNRSQYEEEKAKCLTLVKTNRFKKELTAFIGKQHNDYGRNDFYTYRTQRILPVGICR